MSRKWQLAAAGIVLAIILWIVGIPWWAPVLIILAALAVPVVGYMMLDSNQRARIRRMQKRRQIGH
jgi:cell division protein FtsW (lipid II flippase)